jgi:hypothetical protein
MPENHQPGHPILRGFLGHTLLGVAGCILLLAACADDDDGGLQSITVNVRGSGAGSGTVVSSDPAVEIDCTITDGVEGGGPSCSRTFDDIGNGGLFNLVATPAEGSSFSSWSGCSSSSGATCTLSFASSTIDTTFSVTATFTLDTQLSCNNPEVIEDQFASDAGWTTSVITSGATVATQSVAFQGSGGNLGGYRQMQHVFTGQGSISVYHEYGTTTYDPGTQGAIDHINYYEDEILINPPFAGAAIGTGFTMSQAGIRYSAILWPPSGAFTNVAWGTASLTDLTAASFSPGLNFSTGGPITFGYFRSNTNTGGAALTLDHGIDNWKVEICR